MTTDRPLQDAKRRRRVLLVEDHTNLRRLWAEMLRLNGYEADVAANGSEGLDKIAEHEYDAIVCDVHMPVLSGIEMFGACQLQFPWAADRTIFMTGSWYADSEELCKGTGRPCLVKALPWEHLHSALLGVFAANDAAALESTDGNS